MSNQPPLNPDALEAARLVYGGLTECEAASDCDDCDECQVEAGEIIRAYLAVAQPVVNSVEELEALPPCSVIVDKHGYAGLIEYGHVKFAETAKLPMNYVAKRYLPARVLYRPEVNNA